MAAAPRALSAPDKNPFDDDFSVNFVPRGSDASAPAVAADAKQQPFAETPKRPVSAGRFVVTTAESPVMSPLPQTAAAAPAPAPSPALVLSPADHRPRRVSFSNSNNTGSGAGSNPAVQGGPSSSAAVPPPLPPRPAHQRPLSRDAGGPPPANAVPSASPVSSPSLGRKGALTASARLSDTRRDSEDVSPGPGPSPGSGGSVPLQVRPDRRFSVTPVAESAHESSSSSTTSESESEEEKAASTAPPKPKDHWNPAKLKEPVKSNIKRPRPPGTPARHVRFTLPDDHVDKDSTTTVAPRVRRNMLQNRNREIGILELHQIYIGACQQLAVAPCRAVLQNLQMAHTANQHLVKLDLKDAGPIEERGWEAIREFLFHCTKLKALSLENTGVTDAALEGMVKTLIFRQTVESLNVAHNKRLRIPGFEAIARLLTTSFQLGHLNASGVPMDKKTAGILGQALGSCGGLHTLVIAQGNLKAPAVLEPLMEGLSRNKSVRNLLLPAGGLTPQGAKLCAHMLQQSTTLRHLDLSGNAIQDLGAQFIADAVASHNHIQKLVLARNKIHADGLRTLSLALMKNRSLEVLDVSFNEVANAEALEILKNALLSNRTLTELYMTATGMTSEGAIVLAESVAESKSLTRVDLCRNALGTAGLLALRSAMRMNTSIQQLAVDTTGSSAEYDAAVLTEIQELCKRNVASQALKAGAPQQGRAGGASPGQITPRGSRGPPPPVPRRMSGTMPAMPPPDDDKFSFNADHANKQIKLFFDALGAIDPENTKAEIAASLLKDLRDKCLGFKPGLVRLIEATRDAHALGTLMKLNEDLTLALEKHDRLIAACQQRQQAKSAPQGLTLADVNGAPGSEQPPVALLPLDPLNPYALGPGAVAGADASRAYDDSWADVVRNDALDGFPEAAAALDFKGTPADVAWTTCTTDGGISIDPTLADDNPFADGGTDAWPESSGSVRLV